MRVDLFDFELPPHLIATEALLHRDASRMLVVQPDVPIADRMIKSFPDYLRAGDILVLNNTKVIPARLRAKRGEASVELLLHQSIAEGVWSAFAKPAKRLKLADIIILSDGSTATITEKYADGQVALDFHMSNKQLLRLLEQIGEMPLPPYIEKMRKADAGDVSRYQTVFADDAKAGSVAAPTAGLHFTPELLEQIKAKGIDIVHVTLNVGAGTFQPVKVEDTTEHKMHSEFAELSAEVAAKINATKQNGGRVVAVGTTSLRTLESAALATGRVEAFSEDTRLFITPGFDFKVVDILLTNFHLPKSTLFMLVSAFTGREEMLAAYQHAIEKNYRFYSYGDACLLFRA